MKLQSWSEHFKRTGILGFPLVLSQLAHYGIGVSDTVMVGWLGTSELASLILATQLMFIISVLGAGFSIAVIPIVATAIGEGELQMVRRSVRMSIWISLAYCVLIVPILLMAEDILLFFGQEEPLAAQAGVYLSIAAWGLIPTVFFNVFRSFFSAVEKVTMLLWVMVGGLLVNILFNYMLIFGNFGAPKLGIAGAAYASLGTNIILAFALWFIYAQTKDLRKYHIFTNFWRVDMPVLIDVFKLGWPIGVLIFSEVGLFTAATLIVGWIGVLELAAHGIVLQLASIAFMVPLGFSAAATIRVGNALGRKDIPNLIRASWTVWLAAIALAVVSAFIFLIFGKQLIALYLDPSLPDFSIIIAIGLPLLFVAALFQLVDSMQIIVQGLLRGAKDTRIPMYICIFAYWGVGMPLAYLLGMHTSWGAQGVWIGLALGLSIACVFLIWRYVVVITRLKLMLP